MKSPLNMLNMVMVLNAPNAPKMMYMMMGAIELDQQQHSLAADPAKRGTKR